MAQVVTAVTRNTDVVVLAITLIPRKGFFFLYLESSNRCTVRNCMRLPVRLKNANHMRWSATVRGLSRQSMQALQTGRRQPYALLPGQKQTDVDNGKITAEDLHGNGQADQLANEGTAAHGPLEPDATWLKWTDFANKVYHVWRLVLLDQTKLQDVKEDKEEEKAHRLCSRL
eukprot:1788686-Amphidinium_carterae.4